MRWVFQSKVEKVFGAEQENDLEVALICLGDKIDDAKQSTSNATFGKLFAKKFEKIRKNFELAKKFEKETFLIGESLEVSKAINSPTI